MKDFSHHQQALEGGLAPEQDQCIVEQTVVLPENSVEANIEPASATTTVSAILGPTPALEQESATRAAARKLQAEAQQPADVQKDKTKSEKLNLPMKKALKTLGNKKNKAKGVYGHKNKTDPADQRKESLENAFDECRGIYVRQYPKGNMMSSLQTQNFFSANPMPYQAAPPVHVPYFPGPYDQAHFIQNPVPQDYSITLGGQIRNPQTNRLPSTFITPTNINTYAIAGRSRLVSGQPILSHHAEIQHEPSYPKKTPLAAAFEAERGLQSPSFITNPYTENAQGPNNNKEAIPGVPFTMKYLDDHLNYKGHRKSQKERAALYAKELREGSNTSENPMTRKSAIPEPIVVKKEDGAGDKVVTMAELVKRVERLEEKMDRVVALLSAGAAAQQKKRQQQREIRPNLTGPPPHIPFGGMEGWYSAVKK